MFANPRYTAKNAPVFLDAAVFETESTYCTVLRPCIMNDGDNPPKALIELDLFLIPAYDINEGGAWEKESYDLESSICITPEDTLRLIRYLHKLLAELFNDHNFLNDVTAYRRAGRIAKGDQQVLPEKSKKVKSKKAKGKKGKQKKGI